MTLEEEIHQLLHVATRKPVQSLTNYSNNATWIGDLMWYNRTVRLHMSRYEVPELNPNYETINSLIKKRLAEALVSPDYYLRVVVKELLATSTIPTI